MSFKMTDLLNNTASETLFAFDLLVEYISINKERKASDELALGVRLLDFPTLLIYQPQCNGNGNTNDHSSKSDCNLNLDQTPLLENDHHDRQSHPHPKPRGDKHAFNKGKSCLFKMNVESLHDHLSNTPLYTMVLDVGGEIPKLVGSSQIALGKLMERIKSDVSVRGISTPSCQGEKKVACIFNLMGEKIGSMSLGYKLISLGASLLPHISENRVLNTSSAHKEECMLPKQTSQTQSISLDPDGQGTFLQNGQSQQKEMEDDTAQGNIVSVATQTQHKSRHQPQQTPRNTANDHDFDEDVTVFCPPHMFYNNTADKTNRNESDDSKLLKLDLESFRVEDVCSDEEVSEAENEVQGHLVTRQTSSSEGQEGTGVTPHALGDTLRQLPLLNALLVELSQLNSQTQPQQQPLPIHPHLAWIYRPVTGPGARDPLTDSQITSPSNNTRRSPSPRLKGVIPQKCSTPQPRAVSCTGRQGKRNKREDVCVSSSKHLVPRKELVYGTTKAFNLRMKHIRPNPARRRECVELLETQTHRTKGKMANASEKMRKTRVSGKKMFHRCLSPGENIETALSSFAVDSSPQGTTRPEMDDKDAGKPQRSSGTQTSLHGHTDSSAKPLEERLRSKEEKKLLVHIPSADYDEDEVASQNDDIHLESSGSLAEPDGDKERGGTADSRLSSPKRSQSGSSSGGEQEAEYLDDFTSLDPSDGYSPHPSDVFSSEAFSSPEPAPSKTMAKTRGVLVSADSYHSDSASERAQRRAAALPVPIRAGGSPQRSLRATTHIIRPRTRASAISISSDLEEAGGCVSGGRNNRSSVSESVRSSGSRRSASTVHSPPRRELSAEAVASLLEPREAEELGDELGSLGLTNKYQHVSQLVANKMPGYTL